MKEIKKMVKTKKSLSRQKKKGEYKPDLLKVLLKQMVFIRRFEEKCAQLYGLHKIGGFCHLYIGQEAISVGAARAIDLADDYVVTSYRDHGHALSCGMNAGSIMAELLGKETGCSRGKGGSMHLFDVNKHMFGGNGIVSSQIPIATGIAFKIKYMKENGVVLCFFGDGAIHQGAFHESLNLAKIWDLPIVYICENNRYGMGTDYKRVSSVHDFSIKASSYGMPGKQVNGMDVIEVYNEVKQAACYARQEGPILLEIKSYRYKGHSMSDPAKYRTKEEVETYKEQDPILSLKDLMISNKLLDEGGFEKIDEACKKDVQEALEFAENSPEPESEVLWEDVVAK